MLSAPKEEERLAVVSFTANDSNRGGFGKVLKSIEGLQQRLEDFSVEDIGQAEEQAKTLAVRLSELQRRLATLAEINEAIRAVDATVEQVSKESSELTKVQGADKVLQLQALVQANKLIRFPRLAKAAKESSRAGSVYPIAKDSQSHFSQAET